MTGRSVPSRIRAPPAGRSFQQSTFAFLRLARRAESAASVIAATIRALFLPFMALGLLPSAVVQMPSFFAVLPFRALIMLSGADPLPMADPPNVPPAIPIPVAGRPFVTPARCGDNLISWRGRSLTDEDTHIDLGHRLSRHQGGSADGHCRRGAKDSFHSDLRIGLDTYQYIELRTTDNNRFTCLQISQSGTTDMHR